MLPVNKHGHRGYQISLEKQIEAIFPDKSKISKNQKKIISLFYNLDLTKTDFILKKCYSKFGPMPRLPSNMLRSYLLSIKLQIHSIDKWVENIRTNPFYAALSGFEPDNVPGIGTFYDFFNRIWLFKYNNFNPHIKEKNTKVKKPDKSQDKADSVEKHTADQLIETFKKEPPSKNQAFAPLIQLFAEQFLDISIKKGLIDSDNLTLAGDGTPLPTSARYRHKRFCTCKERGINNCDCPRYYSQPDCDIGWDSSRKYFYSGYHAYYLADAHSFSDLPIFAHLNPASRHDTFGFIHSWFTMKQCLPKLNVKNLLLDAAHDAMAIYEYCKEIKVVPFIDLNIRRGSKDENKDKYTIGKDGIPICTAGHKMHANGIEKVKHRAKFRCPKSNRIKGCYCKKPCSTAKYGLNVHISTESNPRLFNTPCRTDKKWKEEYENRTSVERTIKRQKTDYHLEDGNHRSSKMWYSRMYAIMMLQHLDAWGVVTLDFLK